MARSLKKEDVFICKGGRMTTQEIDLFGFVTGLISKKKPEQKPTPAESAEDKKPQKPEDEEDRPITLKR